ncbi:hypothetical protein [Herbiconiux sp. VKM Ac-2851]|uniref:hypothetical protein n=1 Tax=Herbiconiux sp. VKM Ac-2851 TaxID=2739025 RepID=UPI001566A91D|nr:hypothetical protein [Herbiconiux sp. VKM Ac-2851]NQX36276.1 hypothetical protein [Herbiconiux sp. VKM Ac-2851]
MNEYPAFTDPATWSPIFRSIVNRNFGATALAVVPCPTKGHKFDRPVRPGTDLCEECIARFPSVLADLARYWPAVVGAIVKSPSGGGQQKVQTSGVRDVSALWNPAATLVRAELGDWVSFMVRTVYRDRPEPEWIDRTLGRVPSADVALNLAVLAKYHSRWLASYPRLGAALFADALQHRSAAIRCLQVTPMRRIQLDAVCTVEVANTQWGPIVCEGQLVAVFPHDSDDIRPSQILCTTHPDHRVPTGEWIDYYFQAENHAGAGT